MISEKLREAVISSMDGLFEEESNPRFEQLLEFTMEVEPETEDLIPLPKEQAMPIALERSKESIKKVLDKADEMGFTDDEFLKFMLTSGSQQ